MNKRAVLYRVYQYAEIPLAICGLYALAFSPFPLVMFAGFLLSGVDVTPSGGVFSLLELVLQMTLVFTFPLIFGAIATMIIVFLSEFRRSVKVAWKARTPGNQVLQSDNTDGFFDPNVSEFREAWANGIKFFKYGVGAYLASFSFMALLAAIDSNIVDGMFAVYEGNSTGVVADILEFSYDLQIIGDLVYFTSYLPEMDPSYLWLSVLPTVFLAIANANIWYILTTASHVAEGSGLDLPVRYVLYWNVLSTISILFIALFIVP